MSNTDIIHPGNDAGTPVRRIAAIEPLPNMRLRVTWADAGREQAPVEVDLSPAIKTQKAYRPLRDPAVFMAARLIADGRVVAWHDKARHDQACRDQVGWHVEVTAETIRELASQIMTSKAFAEFLRRNNLTQVQAAALLGRSRRQIGYYLSGAPIPRVVALACIGYETVKAKTANRTPRSPDIEEKLSAIRQHFSMNARSRTG